MIIRVASGDGRPRERFKLFVVTAAVDDNVRLCITAAD
jgi:hypothetical protein